MRKIFILSFVCLLLLSVTAVPCISQDASGVLEKMIEASGGRKALENIKDTMISGTFDLTQMGMEGTMTISHKEPNMFRQDIEIMGMVITNAFDGEVGWMINPQSGAAEELPEDLQGQAKRGALGYGSAILLRPEKFGITYKLKGEETVDDVKCVVLEQVYSDGHIALMYIDSSTHLLYKTRQPSLNQMGAEVETDVIFSDYKDVDGLPSPHLVTIYQDGEEFAVMTVSEIKYNSGFEASYFKME
jgi:outer membrane lipoprotein-sorting protein